MEVGGSFTRMPKAESVCQEITGALLDGMSTLGTRETADLRLLATLKKEGLSR